MSTDSETDHYLNCEWTQTDAERNGQEVTRHRSRGPRGLVHFVFDIQMGTQYSIGVTNREPSSANVFRWTLDLMVLYAQRRCEA